MIDAFVSEELYTFVSGHGIHPSWDVNLRFVSRSEVKKKDK